MIKQGGWHSFSGIKVRLWTFFICPARKLKISGLSLSWICGRKFDFYTIRCTPYYDTQFCGILPWADIIRNWNIFLWVVKQLPQLWASVYKRTKIHEDDSALWSCVFLKCCLNISYVTPSLSIQSCSPRISYKIARIEAVNIKHSAVVLCTNCPTLECFVFQNLSLKHVLYINIPQSIFEIFLFSSLVWLIIPLGWPVRSNILTFSGPIDPFAAKKRMPAMLETYTEKRGVLIVYNWKMCFTITTFLISDI